tara:strand:+ start:243 stop:452 length:210 start_codon:yes stop_codon:yes gene_type:complete
MAEIITAFGLVGASVVTGIFSLIASRFRRENSEQHQSAMNKLDKIETAVNDIKDWQTDHQAIHDKETHD